MNGWTDELMAWGMAVAISHLLVYWALCWGNDFTSSLGDEMRTLFWGVRSRVFTVENLASIFPWPIKSLGVVLPIFPSAHSPLTTCGTHKICTDRRQLSLESCAPLLVLDFLLVHCLFFRVPVWGLCEIFAAFSSHLHEQTGASNRKQKCDSISMETFLIPA